MLFQNTPADTMNFMIAGFTVIFGVMMAYGVSLFVRRRTLERELVNLEKLEKKGK